ncbi:MAG: aspartate--tRNA ligase [Syntrophus sp. (in: bacteria)]|nr:aspartate--tRNA ligase [Syntrophus sp. (in: bacteria)]
MTYQDRLPCGSLRVSDAGSSVTLAGWVDALRDHGDLLFIHLRDRSGIVQVIFSPEFAGSTIMHCASTLRNEFCVALKGRVQQRAAGTENPNLDTGFIEVMATDIAILSKSEALPFAISEKAMVAGAGVRGADSVSEELRLQFRYLDLRRPTMQDNLLKRHRIVKTVRDFLDEQGFIEIETPMLTKSTPEGARDYLVPSRVHPGNFYALPQSPQLFKQLLMVGGYERYFQIVRCFRDEDLRPNRQPEFTQLDLEASFIDEEFIYELMEALICRIFAVAQIQLPRPFPRMTYDEAIDKMGSDRPDTRFGLRFVEATDIFRNTSYGIFKQILQRGGCIKGVNIKGQSEKLSKNVLQNEYAKEIVPGFGAKGMTWMRVAAGGLESNIIQFFSAEEQQAVRARFGAEPGDVIVMIADASYDLVTSVLGQLRLHLADRLGLIPANTHSPLWVTDFPLFMATDEGGVTSSHHPFTAPDRTDFDPSDREALLSLRSRAYDVVVNGEELGGGSIRINDRDLQRKIFQALGLTDQEVEQKFGFFLRALDYGAPPHGGIALGMDRVVSMILGTSSIREVIAFPKNRSAFCPLTQAPSPVAPDQLEELGLLGLGGAGSPAGAEQKRDRVDTLSWVSRIGIGDEERPLIVRAVDEAVRLAAQLNERSAEEAALFCVVGTVNRMRKEGDARPSPHARTGEIFRNAPAVKGNYFKVAAVLE